MKKSYKMENLDCANCAAKMEASIAKLPEVTSVTISFMTQRITLETSCDDQAAVLKQANKLCQKVDEDCSIIF